MVQSPVMAVIAREHGESHIAEDVSFKRKASTSNPTKGHEIITQTIKQPQFAYAHLSLMLDPPRKDDIDILTFRSHLTSALSQFLGLTGSAIAVDFLKIEGKDCWIRVPRQDLSAVVAAVGGWVGGSEDFQVGWRVKGSGNWLSTLIANQDIEKIWNS